VCSSDLDDQIRRANVVAVVDRDTVLHGKCLGDVPIRDYASLASVDADVILLAPPAQHRRDIVATVGRHMAGHEQVYVLATGEAAGDGGPRG
jgi:hypothetical protein